MAAVPVAEARAWVGTECLLEYGGTPGAFSASVLGSLASPLAESGPGLIGLIRLIDARCCNVVAVDAGGFSFWRQAEHATTQAYYSQNNKAIYMRRFFLTAANVLFL